MGFHNPVRPWSEIERTLSGRTGPREHLGVPTDGGDGPAWSSHRGVYEPPPDLADRLARRRPPPPGPAYAELHCRSNFSFLAGASHPEELVEEAARLELEALALTDRDGLYGVVRQCEAAAAVGVPTVFGADLGLVDQPGDGPAEGRVVVLARGPRGYAGLARAVSHGQMAGSKGAPRLTLADLAAVGGRARPARAGGWCSPAAPTAWCPPPWRLGARPPPAAAWPRWSTPSGPTTCGSRCGTTATPSTPTATMRWPPWPGGPGSRWWPPTTCATPPRAGAAWLPPWPRCASAAAWTTTSPGCRPGAPPTCAPGPSRPAASPASPGWWPGPASWAGTWPSTCTWWPRSCRPSRAPTAPTGDPWTR